MLNERYRVSAEGIRLYREQMQYAVAARKSVLSSEQSGFLTLFNRYADGQISLEQFIQEGGNKLRLMQLESR